MIPTAFAGEGMWLPLLLKSLNEAEMQSMGMKLTAEDIYSVNQGSLKDAIVHFGGFCTGELISSNGLLLTNHHCGYSEIQSHSSLENNLLKDGFWAQDQSEELANPGLFVRLIDRIDDVSAKILDGVTPEMSDSERQSVIDKNLSAVKSSYTIEEFQDVMIRPFFHGNQYFAFVTTVYNDVRLVGAPPESIGKFGADTDNWEWPRHTGDFSLFRVYAGPDNKPAEYSEDNVPYQPKHHLPISLDGVSEGDFTMVFGFPGRTNQYLPSFAVEQLLNTLNPAKISIRENALGIVDEYMRNDESIRLKYASKFASIANYWKKWIGESSGLTRTNALDKKRDFEAKLVAQNRSASPILKQFEQLYDEIEPYALTQDYYREISGRNVEALRIAGLLKRLVDRYDSNGQEGYDLFKGRLEPFLMDLYKNYESKVDKDVFVALVDMYRTQVDAKYIPEALQIGMKPIPNFTQNLADKLYGSSVLTDGDAVMRLMNNGNVEKMKETLANDGLYSFATDWADHYNSTCAPEYTRVKTQIDSLQRLYMKAQMDAFPDHKFYPDANSTMRVTYGQVNGYQPKDGVQYVPVTYLDGVMEKYKPGDYEFDVPKRLIELYEEGDYGDYADTNGKLPICFLGSNHTTGGNSGSPAIDAHGNLIGLNFDRVWEGTMSDINYDVSICRNIMVDARYILFVVDKYAGASHLIDEMTLVHPKQTNEKLIKPRK